MHYVLSVYLLLPCSKFACSRTKFWAMSKGSRVREYTFMLKLRFPALKDPQFSVTILSRGNPEFICCLGSVRDRCRRAIHTISLIQIADLFQIRLLGNYVSLNLVSPQLVRRWCLDHDGVITSLTFRGDPIVRLRSSSTG